MALRQLTAILKRTPRFTQYRKALNRAIWFGRYAVQHKWGWDMVLGERRLVIAEQKPVHGDKLVFRYDDGSGRFDPHQVGIRVRHGIQRRGQNWQPLADRRPQEDRAHGPRPGVFP